LDDPPTPVVPTWPRQQRITQRRRLGSRDWDKSPAKGAASWTHGTPQKVNAFQGRRPEPLGNIVT